jgi:LEA14-like dessication related protein
MNPKTIRRFAALLLLFFLAGCAGVTLERPLQIQLVDVVPQDMTLLEQRMRIIVRIRNPNNQPVAIGGLRFSLTLNKVRLLEALSNKKVAVPRLGEAVTSVSASTTTLTLIRQVLEIDPDKPIDYRLDGTVFLDDAFGSKIPFKNEGRINLPKLLNAGGESLRPILK